MTTIAARRLQAVSGPAIAATALVLSAWFAARAIVAWTRDERPAAPARAAGVTPEPRPAAPARVVEPHDAAALVARNMFCSSCKPPGDDGAPPPGGGGTGARHVLPRLIATHVGAGGSGWATLAMGGLAGGFVTGATLPGGGVIESIERGAIVVRFADGTERVPLESGVVATKDPAPPKPDAKDDPWADRIRVVGENRWEVDRTLIRELVQSGTGGSAAAKGVRLQPVNQDGKLAGVRVVAARGGSLAQKLGLASGDVIEAIDGQAIDSPQVLMSMYDKLGDLRRVDLGVKRKGANVTLTYDLP